MLPSAERRALPRAHTARLLGGVLFGILIAGLVLWSLSPVHPGGSTRQTVAIEKGSTTGTIGAQLQRLGLVHSALAFTLFVRFTGQGHALNAGTYRMSTGASLPTLVRQLATGQVAFRRLVVPEGFDTEQVAWAVAEEHLASRSTFLALARQGTSNFPRRARQRYALEGYLFPATYDVPLNASAEEIVHQMTARFVLQWRQDAALAHAHGLSRRQVITLASIVQRETKLPRELPLVAAVFLNRLRLHMPLQSDPTVLYALHQNGGHLSLSDLNVVSPYNTYRHTGLPPGPICNPGQAAIAAILHPARVGYLFFEGKPDGSHVFSDTYAGQQAAEARYGTQNVTK